jgi:hypothetical protein
VVDTYYCEILDYNDLDEYSSGVYSFEEDADRFLSWGNRTRLVSLSHWVIKETADGPVWLKNRFKASPAPLDQDDLKKFMWDKLRAKNIN